MLFAVCGRCVLPIICDGLLCAARCLVIDARCGLAVVCCVLRVVLFCCSSSAVCCVLV